MTRFEEWLATSPNATWLKVAVGAAVGALASWVATSEVHPLIIAICAAVCPVIVNWANKADFRYGRGSLPGDPFDVWGDE